MKHEWQEATCEKPKTCVVGGEAEGEPLGHEWVESTCDTPKICSRCGTTEGEALGHDWTDATCEEPKTCKRCGMVDGEALGHDFDYATTERPKTCKICGKTDGVPVSVVIYDFSKYCDDEYKGYRFNEDLVRACRFKNENRQDIIEILNAVDGTVIATAKIDGREYRGSIKISDNNTIFACIVINCNQGSDISNVSVIGWDGNLLIDAEDIPLNAADFNEGKIKAAYVETNDDYMIGIVDENSVLHCYLDLKTGKVLNPNESDVKVLGGFDKPRYADKHDEKYDESKWKHHFWEQIMDGYLVCKTEDESWGYVDKDDNELVMYKDATDFNDAGYALVSDDRNKYYIIDTEFNRVGEIDGEGYISAGMCGGHLFAVDREDGTYIRVIVK